jgi:N-acetylglucosaminyldiphosphoundecaprenol N-acetyl-beta-D-mannosaminyltransferase
VAWVAGEPGVVEAAASHLQARHPALHIDAFHGFHPKEGSENLALIARVNAARPDILLVGMGTPLQERWVLENRPRLQVPVVWCLGATADFVSGKVPRGPELLLGQEWLARLVVDPKRLWRRYLLGNWRVMGRALGTRIAKGRAGNEPASA